MILVEGGATYLSTLAFALVTGIATFFSPCAYPLLPGYVGYYVSQTEGERASLAGAATRGVVAGGGVLVTFAALLGIAFVVGHGRLAEIDLFEPVVGALLIGFGALVALDRAPSLSIALPKRRSSVLGFGVVGAGYGLAAAGCVAPQFLSVVTLALSYEAGPAALVLGTYVGSVVVLMIAMTVATGMGLLAGANRLAAHTGTLKRLAGVVMIAAGVGQLYLSFVILDVV